MSPPAAGASAPGVPRRRPRSARGAWTIVAIFAVGVLVLGGLYLSPKGHAPPAPPGVPAGVPDRPLCFATCDARARHTVESLVAGFDRADRAARASGAPDGADFVLLVGVDADEVIDLAAALGTAGSYHPQLFQRARPFRGGDPVGVCVLSRHALYEGGPIGDRRGPTAGVRAVAVADGRRFRVACVSLPPGAEAARPALDGWLASAADTPAVVGGASGGAVGLLRLPPQWVTAAEGREPGGWSWTVVGPARAAAGSRAVARTQPTTEGS